MAMLRLRGRPGWATPILLAFALTAALGSSPDDLPGEEANLLGEVRGIVSYSGPLLDPIPNFEAASRRDPIEVDPQTLGLKDAVAWLEGVPSREDDDREGAEEPIEVDQVNFEFIPHVLAVEAGRPVAFLNNDVANHGVTASSRDARNRFNVTTPPGGSYTHRFRASRQPVAVGCPVHAAMSAWVFVFDHPYFAITGEDGSFLIPDVPPGRYTLHVRHVEGGMTDRRPVVVEPGGPTRLRIAFDGDDLNPATSRDPSG
ncbi:carboxypeptidase regulatory-like domain-containing protein [Tautonia sociabilis]|uniref:Rhamnogalacturonan lyase domain-containing protein n=1 Tax=Tautonia sociabilis TaxID=2080755 RepID=A0A432MGU3_9BACT|nr:carboxypeptidase regulatory-like domain-containing protein [Tautonia sociabilis]RUL85933.1 hypothetical protein TsocGM_17345 [Tautonia sociabilis]